MNFEALQVGWVDLLTVGVLLVGVVVGRKRGLSEELLDLVKWLVILLVGGLLYQPLANFLFYNALDQKPVLSTMTLRMISWLTVALLIMLIFSMVKRRLGAKLIGSDVFGSMEYYLGMTAGAVRFLCMYICALNLLQAPQVPPDQLAAQLQQQEKDLGAIYFPPLGSIQKTFFEKSLTGPLVKQGLASVLIQPASGDSQDLRDDNSLARRREREVDVLMRGR